MFSVALIGGDGAGKTTIAKMLKESFPLPLKYIYMGINIESSNVALPTSKLIQFFRVYGRNKSDSIKSGSRSIYVPKTKKRKFSKLRSVLRLIHRLTEEWYRQILAMSYQYRGYIALYDRHFLFDFFIDDTHSKEKDGRVTERMHRWFLTHLYPQPDLVIFLDAPAKVLFARKGEATLSYLDSRRQAFIQQGAKISNFVKIDATQSLENVYCEVFEQILLFYRKYQSRKN